ncbi:hypothetical protein Agub_g11374 [Astrephomene gubernaculifera]|uniref:Uncharacterized protein n=1 Tax=Astrephomene gubernaculifera TaxID=47775 RepID=A0AAD3DWG0_9CHLO|nr:hypothetical protein Agub_g11374 [Astrephomene gubernaculifera]
MSGPPNFPFPGFRPGMPGGMGYPGAPPGFGGMQPGMGMRPPMMMPPGGMGMGGMPMGMGMGGMRPPMASPLMGPPRPMGGASALAKSVYVPPSIAEKSTTVYVGKIASSVPDPVVKTLLDACGRVKSWKRQVDPDTKQPKGFGFCEFEDAEGVLRAMRLLNGLKLDGQELLLKCNAATQKYTEQYEQQKAAEKAEKKAAKEAAAKAGDSSGDVAGDAKEGEGDKEQGEAEEDEDAAADNRVLEAIMSVVSEREEKSHGSLPPPPPLPAGGLPGAAQAASEFLAQLASPGSSDKQGDAKEREREMRDREREWAREADAERRKEEERRRELDVKYDSKLREWERYERDRAAARERDRERRAQAESDWRRAVRADLDSYDSDDDREPWERRPLHGSRKSAERRKRRLAEEEEDEIDRQREAREAERRAKRAAAAAAAAGEASMHEGTPGPAGSTVGEAYPTPHASQLQNGPASAVEPKQEVKQEPEVDTNDPIYQAMLAAARAPPPVPMPAPQQPFGHGAPGVKVEDEPQQRPQGPGHAADYADHAVDQGHARGGYGAGSPSHTGGAGGAVSGTSGGSAGPAAAAAGAGGRGIFGGGSRMRNTAALAAMFADEEETTQKRQLKPIRYSEEELLSVTDSQPADGSQPLPAVPQLPVAAAAAAAVVPAVPQPPADPKAALKAMMDSIPTSRDGVFSYSIKWSHYNAGAMGEKFKGWVSSKVEQLLGVKEPTLVDYVVKLLGQHTSPAALHGELSPVLDNDTETFVIKLYRMVIYETEKAALGLGQPAPH